MMMMMQHVRCEARCAANFGPQCLILPYTIALIQAPQASITVKRGFHSTQHTQRRQRTQKSTQRTQ